jgi:alpha-ketoglutarate-dependent taurine dioxygenase
MESGIAPTAVHDAPFTTPGAWTRADFSDPADWTYSLQAETIVELEQALCRIRERGKNLANLQPADFPLPSFENDAALLRHELGAGRGFVVLKGLPIDRYTDEEATMLYWGIGSFFGTTLPQNVKGDRVYAVRDEGYKIERDYGTVGVRFSKTTEELHFHTDSAPALMGNTPDVVGLLALQVARSGGESRLVSAQTVHNTIRTLRPDHLARLYRPYHFDRSVELRDNEPQTLHAPILRYRDTLSIRYFRYYIPKGHEIARAPLGAEDIEPLDSLDAIANREELQVSFNMERGDMQFLNNTSVLHSRTAFQDYPDPGQRRHFVRLWLKNKVTI